MQDRRNHGIRASWACGPLAVLFVMASGNACSVEDADGDPGPCRYDYECPEYNVCDRGTCMAAPACELEGDSCSTNGDCCDFDGSEDVGSGLCVDDGSGHACTTICREGDDCSTGCCVALTEEDDYGACADRSVCESQLCAIGVAFLCNCVAEVEPCTDAEIEGFLASCADPSNDLAESLQCIAVSTPGTIDECIDALESCAPSAVAERHDLRDGTQGAQGSEPLPEDGIARLAPDGRRFSARRASEVAPGVPEGAGERELADHRRVVDEYFEWVE